MVLRVKDERTRASSVSNRNNWIFNFFYIWFGNFRFYRCVILGLISLKNKEARKIRIGGLVLGIIGTIVSLGLLTIKPGYIFSGKPETETIFKKEINLGEPIKIGNIQLIFTSVNIKNSYDPGRHVFLTGEKIIEKAKPGYKFAIITVKGKNVGEYKDGLWQYGSERQAYKIEVDKGYFYEPILEEGILNINLLPEEYDTDKLVFQILEITTPVKLRPTIKDKNFVVMFQENE